jgi:hypothetical protein
MARTPIDKALNSRVSSPNSYIGSITNTNSRIPSPVTTPPDTTFNPVTNTSQPSPESSQQQPCGPYGAVTCSQHSQIPPEVCSPHSSLVFLALPCPAPNTPTSLSDLIIRTPPHPSSISNIPPPTAVLTTTDPDDWTEQEIRQWLKNVCLSSPFPTSNLEKPN